MKKMRTSIVALSLVVILVLFSIAATPVSAPKKDGSSLYNISVTGDVEGSGTGKPKGFTFDVPGVCFGDVDGDKIFGEPIPDDFLDSPLTENTCYPLDPDAFATAQVGGHGFQVIVPVNPEDTPKDDPLFVLLIGGGERSKIPGGFTMTFVDDESLVKFSGGTFVDIGATWDLEVTVVKA